MLRVCCFCDKVRDDAQDAMGFWQERQHLPLVGAPSEAATLSYTCCHQCFDEDPRASVFRSRHGKPDASLYRSHLSARRTPRARSWRLGLPRGPLNTKQKAP
jgi:hypothetical protein